MLNDCCINYHIKDLVVHKPKVFFKIKLLLIKKYIYINSIKFHSSVNGINCRVNYFSSLIAS